MYPRIYSPRSKYKDLPNLSKIIKNYSFRLASFGFKVLLFRLYLDDKKLQFIEYWRRLSEEEVRRVSLRCQPTFPLSKIVPR